jgi:ABC-type nitrate/sulfonate/bicarbonate transport system substrate-binding protein
VVINESKKLSPVLFLLIALCILQITLLVTGCTLKPESPDNTDKEPLKRSPRDADSTLILAYEEDSLLSLPLYVAIQKNYFAEEKLQIKLQKYASTREAVEGVLSGKYDLILHGAELGLFLCQQEQGNKIVYLAPCTVNNGWSLLSRPPKTTGNKQNNQAAKNTEASILSKPSSAKLPDQSMEQSRLPASNNVPAPGNEPTPSNTPAQNGPVDQQSTAFKWNATKGKVILATKIGDFSEIVLENILRKQGLRPLVDVHLINNLPPSLRLGTFRSGTAQFFLATEPATTYLEQEGMGQLEAPLHEYTGPLLTSVISVVKEKIPTEGEKYQRFLNAYTRALNWIEANGPDELATAAKAFFPELKEKTLIRGIARYKNLGCWPKNAAIEGQALQKLHTFLRQANELKAPLSDSTLQKLIAPPLAPPSEKS